MDKIVIPHKKGDAETFEKIKAAVEKAHGTLLGDENAGTISMKSPIGFIEGTYEVTDDELIVVITQKPFFVTKRLMQKKLEEFLNA